MSGCRLSLFFVAPARRTVVFFLSLLVVAFPMAGDGLVVEAKGFGTRTVGVSARESMYDGPSLMLKFFHFAGKSMCWSGYESRIGPPWLGRCRGT